MSSRRPKTMHELLGRPVANAHTTSETVATFTHETWDDDGVLPLSGPFDSIETRVVETFDDDGQMSGV